MSATLATPMVSVIVPTYNRCALLEKTLAQFARQRMPASNFEVIVSDDGSSDASAIVAKSFAGALRLKYLFQEDLGFRAGAARNAGARLASAPVLVFVDTGSLPGPDFLRDHLAEHDATSRHAVTGYAYGWNPGVEPVRGLDEALRSLPPEDVVAHFKENPVFQDPRHQVLLESAFDLSGYAVPWPMFLSLNLSLRAEDFWAVGGFDEDFSGWGFEDIELGFRLFRHGLELRMTRDAWVLEWPHERPMEKNLQEADVNLSRFLRKHPEPLVEILWYALQKTTIWSCDSLYRELIAWRDQAHGMDVTAELSAVERQLPAENRIVVIGSGGTIPSFLRNATVVDFDEKLLGRALASGCETGYHSIGMRTPMASKSADTVLITSRMAGLWDRWGEQVLAECHRIGRDVIRTGAW